MISTAVSSAKDLESKLVSVQDQNQDLASRGYVQWDAAGVEQIFEGEEEISRVSWRSSTSRSQCHVRQIATRLRPHAWAHKGEDRIPQPRGLAMKAFNVHGTMLPGDPGLPTQDIEFNSTPVVELADARATSEILTLRPPATRRGQRRALRVAAGTRRR
ncbi:hypothetical protein F5Y19DRAFT_469253 [Xylariaceae sp. FL1651]|nr:hypothetical protein F5Y19DRAFT_469253 [Xylariaceae sp. FL1651]